MKTLLALASLTLSANAFALSPDTIVGTLNAPEVREALANRTIHGLQEEASARCAGCFALSISTYNFSNGKPGKIRVGGIDREGILHLNVTIEDSQQ